MVKKALDKIIGMEQIKSDIENWLKGLEKQAILKKAAGVEVKDAPMHIILNGNSSVSKKMLANNLTEILYEKGYISKNEIFSYQVDELIGKKAGQTSKRTEEAIDKSIGGVFFLDEAYYLSEGFPSNADFGKEAIETILNYLSLPKTVFIFGGTKDKMREFLELQPYIHTQFFLED